MTVDGCLVSWMYFGSSCILFSWAIKVNFFLLCILFGVSRIDSLEWTTWAKAKPRKIQIRRQIVDWGDGEMRDWLRKKSIQTKGDKKPITKHSKKKKQAISNHNEPLIISNKYIQINHIEWCNTVSFTTATNEMVKAREA